MRALRKILTFLILSLVIPLSASISSLELSFGSGKYFCDYDMDTPYWMDFSIIGERGWMAGIDIERLTGVTDDSTIYTTRMTLIGVGFGWRFDLIKSKPGILIDLTGQFINESGYRTTYIDDLYCQDCHSRDFKGVLYAVPNVSIRTSYPLDSESKNNIALNLAYRYMLPILNTTRHCTDTWINIDDLHHEIRFGISYSRRLD